jgi:hypothetical protein
MFIKLFFLAAASAMLMAYNVFQTQIIYRTPSSTAPANHPMAVPTVYSFQDMTSVFENAMAQDHENKLYIDYLTSEIARKQTNLEEARKDRHLMLDMANPYNPISKEISQYQRDLHLARAMRQRNLDKAHWDLLSIYTHIQMPTADGRGLNPQQHNHARWMMSHVLQVKKVMNCTIPALCMSPTFQPEYMVGHQPYNMYSAPSTEVYMGATPPPHVERLEAERFVPQPMALPLGTVEAQPEDAVIM